MAELEVIYDPLKELACIVNVDDQCGFGPAMIGPNAGELLVLWIETMPFDVSLLDTQQAAAVFASFLDATTAGRAVASNASPAMASGAPGSPAMDAAIREAEQEARDTASVPAEQPADADMEADASAPDQVIRCVNCNGAGIITFGDDEPAAQCGMCGGTGRLTVPA